MAPLLIALIPKWVTLCRDSHYFLIHGYVSGWFKVGEFNSEQNLGWYNALLKDPLIKNQNNKIYEEWEKCCLVVRAGLRGGGSFWLQQIGKHATQRSSASGRSRSGGPRSSGG